MVASVGKVGALRPTRLVRLSANPNTRLWSGGRLAITVSEKCTYTLSLDHHNNQQGKE